MPRAAVLAVGNVSCVVRRKLQPAGKRAVFGGAGAAAILLLGLVWFQLTSDDVDQASVGPVVQAAASPMIFHQFPDLLADLRSSRSRVHYVQLAPVVEIAEEQLALLQARQTLIIADMQMALRDLHRQDLRGAAGIERLRRVFATIANQHIAPASVNTVLFTKFLVD